VGGKLRTLCENGPILRPKRESTKPCTLYQTTTISKQWYLARSKRVAVLRILVALALMYIFMIILTGDPGSRGERGQKGTQGLQTESYICYCICSRRHW